MKGLGDDGAIAVAKALAGNQRVSQCFLGANGITFQGLKSLAALLSFATSGLVELDLHQNPLGAAGAACLARALERNTALRRLNLDACRVGNFGAAQMVAPLEANTCLVALTLTANGIGTKTGDAIRAAVAANRIPRDIACLEVLY
eukprot:CAMPEP_0172631226 /NCGR_PEP_ID=MMETSP1068-20121228/177991_1 /TAXON_ID=35684 /ORGANISM="Pseudopedinella elastica, Strain CCMP716" /LENGTH=145 /DNA_ID=CAMNT_0013442299 /DNA_START=129 /DNA_END=566 /DNA_ORIENTATION=-